MVKPGLSDREAALIEAARRELAARGTPGPAAGSIAGPATGSVPGPAHQARSPLQSPAPAPAMHRDAPGPARPEATERIAALMQAEREGSRRRKKRLLKYGTLIPAGFLIAAVIWAAAAFFRYATS